MAGNKAYSRLKENHREVLASEENQELALLRHSGQ